MLRVMIQEMVVVQVMEAMIRVMVVVLGMVAGSLLSLACCCGDSGAIGRFLVYRLTVGLRVRSVRCLAQATRSAPERANGRRRVMKSVMWVIGNGFNDRVSPLRNW
jgi:hypothetical protein